MALISTDSGCKVGWVPAHRDLEEPMTDAWYERPITRQDVADAVTRYAPHLPPTEFAAFVEFVAETWEGVVWGDAGAWDMRVEWSRWREA